MGERIDSIFEKATGSDGDNTNTFYENMILSYGTTDE